MPDSTAFYVALCLGGVFISAVSQVLLKKSAMRPHANALREYLNPWVIGGYALFFLATLANVMAYRGIPLSLGPVLETTSYVYITFFGVTLFKEKLSRKKLLALALILAGIGVSALG